MKVCLVYTSGISTTRGGGIASKMKNIIKETFNEIDYTIVTSIEKPDCPDLKFYNDLGVDVKGFSSSHNSIIDSWRLFKCVPDTKFNIIHFQDFPLALDTRFGFSTGSCLLKPNFRKAELIYEHQIAAVRNLHPLYSALQDTAFKALFPFWKKVLVNSNYMLSETHRLVDCKSKKFKLIPLGVASEEISKSTPLSFNGISLIYFGHLTYIKGVDILIKAFCEVSQRGRAVHLHLFGDGNLRGFCEGFVRRKNLTNRVHFWGAVPQGFLFRAIKGADICVLPSRNDSGPLSVLEAMAAGKPIISTNRGGIPELMKDGRNGVLIEPEVNQLTKAIEFLIGNPDIRQKIGRENAKDATAHSWDKVSGEYLALYRSLAENKEES